MKNTIIVVLGIALLAPSITMSASVRASSGFRSSSFKSSSYRPSSRVTPIRNNPAKPVKTVKNTPVITNSVKSKNNIINEKSNNYSYNPISSNFFLWWWILGNNNRHATTTNK